MFRCMFGGAIAIKKVAMCRSILLLNLTNKYYVCNCLCCVIKCNLN